MILEKESEVKVLRNFYEHIFDYLSIAEINKKTKISRNWIYKIIKKFEDSKVVLKFDKKYKLDFSNLFCKRLKLLFDSEDLNSLQDELKNRVFNIANKIIFEANPESIILVGSVALQKQKLESDIDFLVIGKNKKIPYFEKCNIVMLDDKEFKEKYLKGDEFIISALLFGKIISDKDFFIKFFESPLPILSQEIIQEKIKYCERLEERIYTLLKTDEKKAKEELLYFVLQIARIILLKNQIIPKTKYDLAEQIMTFNKKIAQIIKEVLKKKKLSKDKILNYIKICAEILR